MHLSNNKYHQWYQVFDHKYKNLKDIDEDLCNMIFIIIDGNYLHLIFIIKKHWNWHLIDLEPTVFLNYNSKYKKCLRFKIIFKIIYKTKAKILNFPMNLQNQKFLNSIKFQNLQDKIKINQILNYLKSKLIIT